MGTPIDKSPPGVLCTNCWGGVQFFGPGPTPLYIEVVFDGILKGTAWIPADGEPPNRKFTLTQEAGIPCHYLSNEDGYTVRVQYQFFSTGISCFTPNSRSAFSRVSSKCILSASNSQLNPLGHFYQGSASVSLVLLNT